MEILYFELGEIKSKHFLKTLQQFINNGFRIGITLNTRHIFPFRDKNDYKLCVLYKGDSSCGSRYIGETKSIPGAMHSYNKINIIIQVKVQNYRSTFEKISITV